MLCLQRKKKCPLCGGKMSSRFSLGIYMFFRIVIMKELIVYVIKKEVGTKFNLYVQFVEKMEMEKDLLEVLDALFVGN